MMMRSSVVLPQPDWPMMPTTAPRGIARSMSRSTGRAGVVAEGNVLDFNDLRLLHGVILSSMGEAVKHRGARQALRPTRGAGAASTSRSRAGEAFGLVGANGAGKTTLIKCVLDLCARRRRDRDLRHRRAAPRGAARLAYLPERFNPPYYLRGARVPRHDARARRRALRRSARRWRCSTSSSWSARRSSGRCARLSKGMTQKLGLAACFLLRARSLRARRADERP